MRIFELFSTPPFINIKGLLKFEDSKIINLGSRAHARTGQKTHHLSITNPKMVRSKRANLQKLSLKKTCIYNKNSGTIGTMGQNEKRS